MTDQQPNQLTEWNPDLAAKWLANSGATYGNLATKIHSSLSDRLNGPAAALTDLRGKISQRIADNLSGPAATFVQLYRAADVYRQGMNTMGPQVGAVVDPPGVPAAIEIQQIVTPLPREATADQAATNPLSAGSTQAVCTGPIPDPAINPCPSGYTAVKNPDGSVNCEPPPGIVHAETPIQTLAHNLGISQGLCSVNLWVEVLKGSKNLKPGGPGTLASLIPAGGVTADFFRSLLGGLDNIVRDFFSSSGCGSAQESAARVAMFVFGLLEHFTGEAIGDFKIPIEYLARGLCPTEFPGAEEALAAYLADAITPEVYESWVKINNKCLEPHEAVLETKRSKLRVPELVLLYRRSLLSRKELTDGIRRLGYTKNDDSSRLLSLSDFVPSPDEAIRFADRQAFGHEQQVIDTAGTGFGDFYLGDARKYLDAAGVAEQQAREMWRSHWAIPNFGSMAEVLHRTSGQPAGSPTATTLDDLRTYVKQGAVHPFWQERMIATVFSPLEKRDLRQAANVGVIDTAGVAVALQKTGYAAADAQKIATTYERMRDDALVGSRFIRLWIVGAIPGDVCVDRLLEEGHPQDAIDSTMGEAAHTKRDNQYVRDFAKRRIVRGVARQRADNDLWPANLTEDMLADAAESYHLDPVVVGYDRGLNTLTEATAELTKWGLLPAEQASILDPITDRLRVHRRRKCIDAAVKRYVTGELTSAQLRVNLLGQVNDNDLVDGELAVAVCEQSARGKSASTAELCTWLGNGQILPEEFVQRMQNVGWTHDDALRYLTNCLEKINQRQAAEALKHAKADAAAIAKAEAAAQRQGAKIARLQAQQAKARQTAQATGVRREKVLLHAADLVRKIDGVDLADALTTVRQQKGLVETQYGLGIDAAIAVIMRAAEDRTATDGSIYVDRVAELAAAVADHPDGSTAALSPESSILDETDQPGGT